MRALVWIPIATLVVGLVGRYMCNALGIVPDMRAMVIAAVTCLATGELAAMPVFLVRNAAQPAVSQAALIGTIIHLFGSLAVAAVVFLAKVQVGQTFVYWLMAFYIATLIALVAAFAQSIRNAPSLRVK